MKGKVSLLLCCELCGTLFFSSFFFDGTVQNQLKTVSILQNFLVWFLLFQLVFHRIVVSLFFNEKFSLKRIVLGLISFFFGTVCWHFIAILFGAPIINDFQRTLLWSSVMSTFTWVPSCWLAQFSLDSLEKFLLFSWPQNRKELLWYYPAVSSILGAWLGAFVIPLDWDRPWQVWPLSCTYGSVLGYILGILVSLVANFLNHSQNDN